MRSRRRAGRPGKPARAEGALPLSTMGAGGSRGERSARTRRGHRGFMRWRLAPLAASRGRGPGDAGPRERRSRPRAKETHTEAGENPIVRPLTFDPVAGSASPRAEPWRTGTCSETRGNRFRRADARTKGEPSRGLLGLLSAAEKASPIGYSSPVWSPPSPLRSLHGLPSNGKTRRLAAYFASTPSGIRTRDLRLERPVS